MTGPAGWPAAAPITSDRLVLEPLRVGHAAEMASVLDDPALHRYIGGEPATAAELGERYLTLVAGGSPDGAEGWLNWVVRRRDNNAAVGYVQATVTGSGQQYEADVAWVFATPHQHQGFAVEAARLMVDWLRRHGATTIFALIHPDHRASEAVASKVGLSPTDEIVDGEVRWVG